MDHDVTHYDRTIFHAGTSLFATSLYLVITGLYEQTAPTTVERIRECWNGTEKELEGAVCELLHRGIIARVNTSLNGNELRVVPSTCWGMKNGNGLMKGR